MWAQMCVTSDYIHTLKRTNPLRRMLIADVDGNETVIILMSEEMKGAVAYVRSTLFTMEGHAKKDMCVTQKDY